MSDFKIDFSKLSTDVTPINDRDPFKIEDREYFDRKTITARKLQVTACSRVDHRTDDRVVRAFFAGSGDRCDIVLPAQREEMFKAGLGNLLHDMHETAIFADDYRDAIEHRIEATVAGDFQKRWWKDGQGKWQYAWQVTAATWSYETMQRGRSVTITEGQWPSPEHATFDIET